MPHVWILPVSFWRLKGSAVGFFTWPHYGTRVGALSSWGETCYEYLSCCAGFAGRCFASCWAEENSAQMYIILPACTINKAFHYGRAHSNAQPTTCSVQRVASAYPYKPIETHAQVVIYFLQNNNSQPCKHTHELREENLSVHDVISNTDKGIQKTIRSTVKPIFSAHGKQSWIVGFRLFSVRITRQICVCTHLEIACYPVSWNRSTDPPPRKVCTWKCFHRSKYR